MTVPCNGKEKGREEEAHDVHVHQYNKRCMHTRYITTKSSIDA